jgi:hypothetical protein
MLQRIRSSNNQWTQHSAQQPSLSPRSPSCQRWQQPERRYVHLCNLQTAFFAPYHSRTYCGDRWMYGACSATSGCRDQAPNDRRLHGTGQSSPRPRNFVVLRHYWDQQTISLAAGTKQCVLMLARRQCGLLWALPGHLQLSNVHWLSKRASQTCGVTWLSRASSDCPVLVETEKLILSP